MTLQAVRWHEIRDSRVAPLLTPGSRVFQREADGGHLSVFVSREPDPHFPLGRWHMSISHRTNDTLAPGRLPSWEEIAEARYRFVPDSAWMALYLPPKSEYVNVHETTMHMWETPKGFEVP